MIRAPSLFILAAVPGWLPLCGEEVIPLEITHDWQSSSDRVELRWPSTAGRDYSVWQGTDLDTFTELSKGLQATQPENVWWADRAAAPRRFFVVRTPAAVPPANLIGNGDFGNALTGWSSSVGTGASATLSVVGGEFFADIIDGGPQTYSIFLRQFGLPLIQDQEYTLLFDARSAGAERTIRVLVQTAGGSPNYLAENIAITGEMRTYRSTFTMTDPDIADGRVGFNLGADNNGVHLDKVQLFAGTGGVVRQAASRVNERLHRGNNFMAAKSMNNQGAAEDYALLNASGFKHCRIGYKMDEVAGGAPDYTLPAANMQALQNMVDWCLAEGLIAIVDPVHNWANNGDAELEFDPATDFPKLGRIWEQVAAHFADYDPEQVLFEIMNEPHGEDDIVQIIDTVLPAIRGTAGSGRRVVIVPGDGFSTRQALIDAFNNDEIPAGDPCLIGTFHYYDPRDFTKQGSNGLAPVTWGSAAEFDEVASDFAAVVTANDNWAARNHTEPLPVYLGEFGADNEADLHHGDRKRWLSWVRMQAEAHGFSWAHWNMYDNDPPSKGMGPWTGTEINNPDQRSFDAGPLEALTGHYEFEDGSQGTGVVTSTGQPGFSGSGYRSFPATTGFGVWTRVDGIHVPKSGTYAVEIHYSSAVARTLRLVARNDAQENTQVLSGQVFPATGGDSCWATMTVPVDFDAGEAADLKVVADSDEGVNLDWLRVTLP